MHFIEFIDVQTEGTVYIQPEHVVCVRQGDEAGSAKIITTANANGLHVIEVDEEPSLVIARLEGRH